MDFVEMVVPTTIDREIDGSVHEEDPSVDVFP